MHTDGDATDSLKAVVRMVILLGVLIGLLIGALACARYLRQEIAANIGPRLRHIELQLDTLHAELNLATETRLAALSRRIDRGQPDN
jgi:hypothetical protein